MSKDIFFSRYSLIIKRLQKGAASYEQIRQYIEREAELLGRVIPFSVRTLQRDIIEIYEHLGFEIKCNKKNNTYYIASLPEHQDINNRLLESYEMINIIKASDDYANHVLLETRKPAGLEHFHGLLYAIKTRKVISFSHYKFYDETLTQRTVHPLALKEAQERWYLLAVDTKDNRLKTFGLDRMSDLEISKTSFRNTYSYNIKEMFQHSFGIINPNGDLPQKVRLSFSYEQGQYIKTFPLHHSQKVVEENDEVIIELFIVITYDFVMELLSFGEELKILQPVSLINQLKKTYSNALGQYL